MKKETLMEIILGTIGSILFGIGMCMCLLPEWHLFKEGVVVACVGVLGLLLIIPFYKKSHPKKEKMKRDWVVVFPVFLGIVASLIMGFGMSKIMTGNPTTYEMIFGIVVGSVGLIICILNYPVYCYLKGKKG